MSKHIIHIFGASGSGTSTLGRVLAEKTGYTFLDSDNYIWTPTDPPFTALRSREQRLPLLQRDMEKVGDAILSGSLVGWGDPLIPRFTLAVRLVTTADVRLDRIKKREHERFGDRILPGGDMYEQHQNFLAWAAAYDEGPVSMRSRAMHDLWQQKLSCPLLTLDGARPVDELAAAVLRSL